MKLVDAPSPQSSVTKIGDGQPEPVAGITEIAKLTGRFPLASHGPGTPGCNVTVGQHPDLHGIGNKVASASHSGCSTQVALTRIRELAESQRQSGKGPVNVNVQFPFTTDVLTLIGGVTQPDRLTLMFEHSEAVPVTVTDVTGWPGTASAVTERILIEQAIWLSPHNENANG